MRCISNKKGLRTSEVALLYNSTIVLYKSGQLARRNVRFDLDEAPLSRFPVLTSHA